MTQWPRLTKTNDPGYDLIWSHHVTTEVYWFGHLYFVVFSFLVIPFCTKNLLLNQPFNTDGLSQCEVIWGASEWHCLDFCLWSTSFKIPLLALGCPSPASVNAVHTRPR